MSPSDTVRHTRLEDAQALLVASLFVAFAVMLIGNAGLFTGGTIGIAFLIHYLSQWPMGPVLLIINLPFYLPANHKSGRYMGT
jgi:uncharacterized membrane-anchored protein YitT (DUF2179 family)